MKNQQHSGQRIRRLSHAKRLLVFLTLSVGVAIWLYSRIQNASNLKQSNTTTIAVSDLSSLLALPVEAMRELDIARMNLLCAQGLPGAEDLDVNRSLTRLDEMAARVRTETERHYYRFQSNPAEFENSAGFFRMLMLAVVLVEDFKARILSSQ